jgi:hypothetical protein
LEKELRIGVNEHYLESSGGPVVNIGDIVFMNTNLDEQSNFEASTNTRRYSGPGIICSIKRIRKNRNDKIPHYFKTDVIEVYWIDSGSKMLFPIGTKLLKMAHES